MKKILLASVGVFALAASGAQAAEPLKLSLGGMMVQQVGYADQDQFMRMGNFDTQNYAEVNFSGLTKLDNGISIGVDVNTYASQGQDSRNANAAKAGGSGANANIRRAWMTVGSAYGQVLLGQREDFGMLVHNTAPNMGWGLTDGDWLDWIAPTSAHNGVFTTNNNRYTTRTDKITYMTPVWEGLQGGFTYTPDIAQKNAGALSMVSDADQVRTANGAGAAYNPGIINVTSFAGNQYQVGAVYKNALGPVGVKADLAYSRYDMANLQTYQSGLQLSYAGFILGGSYFYRDVGKNENAGSGNLTTTVGGVTTTNTVNYVNGAARAMMRAGQSFDIGVGYKGQDFGVSFSYYHDQTKNDANFNGLNTASGTDVYALSGGYTMGPGVEWRNSLYYVNYDNEYNAAVSNVKGDGNTTSTNGIAFVTGIMVSF